MSEFLLSKHIMRSGRVWSRWRGPIRPESDCDSSEWSSHSKVLTSQVKLLMIITSLTGLPAGHNDRARGWPRPVPGDTISHSSRYCLQGLQGLHCIDNWSLESVLQIGDWRLESVLQIVDWRLLNVLFPFQLRWMSHCTGLARLSRLSICPVKL